MIKKESNNLSLNVFYNYLDELDSTCGDYNVVLREFIPLPNGNITFLDKILGLSTIDEHEKCFCLFDKKSTMVFNKLMDLQNEELGIDEDDEYENGLVNPSISEFKTYIKNELIDDFPEYDVIIRQMIMIDNKNVRDAIEPIGGMGLDDIDKRLFICKSDDYALLKKNTINGMVKYIDSFSKN